MERLQYLEIGQQLKMFKSVNSDNDDQLQLKRKKYQIRDKLIKTLTEKLRTEENFTVEQFLEGLMTRRASHTTGKKYMHSNRCSACLTNYDITIRLS